MWSMGQKTLAEPKAKQFPSSISLVGHARALNSAVFNRTGKKVVSSWDQTARAWVLEGNQWRCEAELKGHTGTVNAVMFDATVMKEGNSLEKIVRIWKIHLKGKWKTYEGVFRVYMSCF